MNYYEQLGVSPNATAEEIKEAYRSLVRLLHPDHHPDPQLQKVAERQVQKLNLVYATLSDPDRRRQYDRDVAESSERIAPIIIRTPPPRRERFLNKSSLAWITAVGVFIVLLIWMASRPVKVDPAAFTRDAGASLVESSPSKPAVAPPAPEPVAVTPPVLPPVKKAQPPPALLDSSKQSAAEAEALRLKLARAMGERDMALSEVNRLQTRAEIEKRLEIEKREKAVAQREAAPVVRLSEQKPSVFTPPPPPVLAKVAAPPPLPEIPIAVRHPMSGFWVYRKPTEAPKNKDLYPPEFIETNITEENGQVRGTYRARYRAPNRPVSPDVTFQFAGRLNGESGSLPWNGSGGSRGEVTLKLMADHSLRVDWTASQLGTLGFYRGTAVLVRRSD